MPTGIYKRTAEHKNKIRLSSLGRKVTRETRKKISEALMGKILSKEHRKKLSLAKKGKIPPCTFTRRSYVGKSNPAYGKVYIEGKKHHEWKGDNVGYCALHDWIKRKLGKPTKCENCGKDGLKGRKIHWANIDHTYKRNLNDWIRLCCSCHKVYDNKLNNI